MGFEGKPENVQEALNNKDKEALSRMGKKGAKTRATNFAIKKDTVRQQNIEHEYNRILHESGQEAADEFIKELE